MLGPPAMAQRVSWPGETFDHAASELHGRGGGVVMVNASGPGPSMEAFLVSTGVVALAEIGDKTQLLALVLATRFRKPAPIIAGILVATLLNHAAAGALGAWITTTLPANSLRWILGLGFLAMAAWVLVPDRLDSEAHAEATGRLGVFGTTLVAFFFAEMGDKTQLATIAMAAHFSSAVAVIIGTTLGMMIANVPVVIIGDRLAGRIPMRLVHAIAAVIFAVLGLLALFGADTMAAGGNGG